LNSIAGNQILTEVTDTIGLMRFNRPQVLNALIREVMDELVNALESSDRNHSLRCSIAASLLQSLF